MRTGRRSFLKNLALSIPAVYAGSHLVRNIDQARAQTNTSLLPLPDFSEKNILRSVAGLRPLRTNGIRLEAESVFGKQVIHNYGHGGAGFTMSWGSALEVSDILKSSVAPSQEIAILGAGVIGLSTALILRQRGYRVKIYAAKITPQTTSDLAGAQWSPSFVSSGTTPFERVRHNRILQNSYRKFETIAGEKYGVHLRPNYLFAGFTDDLLNVPTDLLKPIVEVAKFPFAGRPRGGSVIQAWLIEPPIYIPALMNDLRELAVEIELRDFKSFDQIKELDESVVINCCGLGAARLVNDVNLIPLKGQLVHLKPQRGLDYILLYSGYVFCRKDAIVVGGSFQKGIFDTTPDPAVASKILENNRRFFA